MHGVDACNPVPYLRIRSIELIHCRLTNLHCKQRLCLLHRESHHVHRTIFLSDHLFHSYCRQAPTAWPGYNRTQCSYLADSPIGNVNEDFATCAESLAEFESLRKLCLHNCDELGPDDETVARVLASLPTLRHLQLSFWQGAIIGDCLLSQLPDEVAKVLPALTNLTCLELQVRTTLHVCC